MNTIEKQHLVTKYRLIDFISWLGIGGVFFLLIRVLGPFSLVADMGNVPVGSEGRAMLEMMCFVAGFSSILVGISHVFSSEFRSEATDLTAPHSLNRRHHRHARVGVLMIAGFIFSLAGLIVWLLPIDGDRRAMSPGLSLVSVAAFALMTLLTGSGAVLSMRRQRLFDRRHALA